MEDNKENKSSSTSFKVFVVSIILIILYPPMDYWKRNFTNSGSIEKFKNFSGWDFIWNLSGDSSSGFELNITYLIIEILVVCIIFFSYRASSKK